MSGICGIWRLDGRPLDPTELGRVAEPTAHRGLDGQRHWSSPHVALVCQQTKLSPKEELQPVTSSAAVVVFDGRLDNRDVLVSMLNEQDRLAASSDAMVVLGGYGQFGASVFGRLHGDFAVAVYDRTAGVLHLARDIVGPQPLYYARTHAAVTFSSEIKGVLQCPGLLRKPCEDALADYLLPGDFQERELTCFEGVKRVLPGTVVTVTRSAIHVAQHDG